MTRSGARHIPEHIPCQCGHMGWRHHTTGACARCHCDDYQQPPLPEPPTDTLLPRRRTRKRILRPPA